MSWLSWFAFLDLSFVGIVARYCNCALLLAFLLLNVGRDSSVGAIQSSKRAKSPFLPTFAAVFWGGGRRGKQRTRCTWRARGGNARTCTPHLHANRSRT